jgi:hypothetical protein
MIFNFLFQNLTLDGKKLQYKLKAPFEEVLLANTHHSMGRVVEELRMIFVNSAKYIHIPDVINMQ